jgi:hypothetical protein
MRNNFLGAIKNYGVRVALINNKAVLDLTVSQLTVTLL